MFDALVQLPVICAYFSLRVCFAATLYFNYLIKILQAILQISAYAKFASYSFDCIQWVGWKFVEYNEGGNIILCKVLITPE